MNKVKLTFGLGNQLQGEVARNFRRSSSEPLSDDGILLACKPRLSPDSAYAWEPKAKPKAIV